jgi:hypothetical protein
VRECFPIQLENGCLIGWNFIIENMEFMLYQRIIKGI